ncbi:MAG: GNAT family N-acetyltransferase [Clostridiales bacterium]|nr:GNAT family N-acetyltransferase [Clostridiales bacterium]
MQIRRADLSDTDAVASLVAKFRVALAGLGGAVAAEDATAAQEEFADYLRRGYPIYIYQSEGRCLGYIVCRVDAPTVWVESLYVLEEHRRHGIATALFETAEQVAASYGEDTMYNYVHPNNDGMITFLKKRGYDMLNLIEIRKRGAGEPVREEIRVRNNTFGY